MCGVFGAYSPKGNAVLEEVYLGLYALQLNRVVRNSFQQEVNKRTLNELLSSRREELMEDVKREVRRAVAGARTRRAVRHP